MVVSGKSNDVPHFSSLCGYGTNGIDSKDQISLDCPAFSDLRATLIFPLLKQDSLEPNFLGYKEMKMNDLCVFGSYSKIM